MQGWSCVMMSAGVMGEVTILQYSHSYEEFVSFESNSVLEFPSFIYLIDIEISPAAKWLMDISQHLAILKHVN